MLMFNSMANPFNNISQPSFLIEDESILFIPDTIHLLLSSPSASLTVLSMESDPLMLADVVQSFDDDYIDVSTTTYTNISFTSTTINIKYVVSFFLAIAIAISIPITITVYSKEKEEEEQE